MDIKNEFENEKSTDHVLDVQIKEEPELIIDDDVEWTPNEETEYYQEFFEECSQTVIRTGFETYKIQFLDESRNYVDDKSNFYSEGDKDCESCDEDFDMLIKHIEVLDDSKTPQKLVASESELQKQINKWLSANFIEYVCPECKKRYSKYIALRKHLEKNHKDSFVETERNYFFGNECGVCKKCNKQFSTMAFRYFHAMKHEKNYAKLEINICKVCNFKAKNIFFVQKHISENHSEIIKDFKINIKMNCPICFSSYKNRKQMIHHFMYKHAYEYKAEIIFNCHLCVGENFNKEQSYLQHLAEIHELNSWEILNFRQIIYNQEFVACTECGTLFAQTETLKLLKHFLKHENNSFWTCKFCSKRVTFQKQPARHMCLELVEHYNNHYYDNKIDNYSERKECRIQNVQDFENYIAHVCPFCNKEYSKMVKWHQHLKKIHAIETLKGLEMKKILNDANKLCCVICHSLVANSPEKLHAHRFQHLPFKPYKCIACSCMLSTFKMAVDHASSRCKEEDDRSLIKDADDSPSDIRLYLEIRCSVCTNKKFNDVKSSFRHYKDEHNNFDEFFTKNSDGSVTCKICYKQLAYNYKKPFCLHIINHFDEKTFQCKVCLQSYATLKIINHHFLTHPKTRAFCQQACKKDIQETSSLHDKCNRVVTNVTTLAVSSIKSYVLNEFADFIGFVCPECNEDMGTQPMWQDHIAEHHSFFKESEIYVKDADGTLKCTTCKMKLPTSILQQQKHKLTHMPYKSFMCTLCYVRCNSLGILYGHFRRRHFAKGSFDCPLCPEISETSYHRTKHLKDKHPREEWPNSLCLICYQILKTPSGLRTHMKVHDIDRVKYNCEICGSKIIELKDFNVHMERHKKKGDLKDRLNDDMTSSPKSQDDRPNDMSSEAIELKDINGVVRDKHNETTSSSKSEGGSLNGSSSKLKFNVDMKSHQKNVKIKDKLVITASPKAEHSQGNESEKKPNKNFMRSQVTLNKYLKTDHVVLPSTKRKKYTSEED